MFHFESHPKRYVQVVANTSDLMVAIPDDVNPVEFIVEHLKDYMFDHIFAIRVFYYDADYSGR